MPLATTAEQAVSQNETEGRNTTYEANAGSQVRESGRGLVYNSGRADGEKYRDLKDIETKNLLGFANRLDTRG